MEHRYSPKRIGPAYGPSGRTANRWGQISHRRVTKRTLSRAGQKTPDEPLYPTLITKPETRARTLSRTQTPQLMRQNKQTNKPHSRSSLVHLRGQPDSSISRIRAARDPNGEKVVEIAVADAQCVATGNTRETVS